MDDKAVIAVLTDMLKHEQAWASLVGGKLANQRIEALSVALDSLTGRHWIERFYNHEITVEKIDVIACERCGHRDKNRECPITGDEKCPQTAEEAIDIFMKWIKE